MNPSGGDPEPRQWFDAAGRGQGAPRQGSQGSDNGSSPAAARAGATGQRPGADRPATMPTASGQRGRPGPGPGVAAFETAFGHREPTSADRYEPGPDERRAAACGAVGAAGAAGAAGVPGPAANGYENGYESALDHGDPPPDRLRAAAPGSAPAGPTPDSRWYDDDAGPLVRLYALTRGRARPRHEVFDLIALITARPDRAQYRHDPSLGPEHAAVLELSSQGARSVADLAADCDLPLGVTRVILSDLLEVGLIQVSRPAAPDRFPDERMLREVINGLRAL